MAEVNRKSYDANKRGVYRIIDESINAKRSIPVEDVLRAVDLVCESYRNGGKVLVCGNGGSAADAQHMSGELVNRFLLERKPLACIALNTDTSVGTAIGNDYGFEYGFSKQVEAYAKKGDILIGISTSGKSPNVLRAVETASKLGMKTVGFMGRGGNLEELCDVAIKIDSKSTPRIQEAHEVVMHIICEYVEKQLKEECVI